MSAEENQLDPSSANGNAQESAKSSAIPIDFTAAINRLISRAAQARKTGKKNKTQSTAVAALAITALFMVVVGAEDVVRRQLAPDVRDVTAAKLTAANEAAKSAAEDVAPKKAAEVVAKARFDTIIEEEAAAKRAVSAATDAEADRAKAFAASADALAEKQGADADVESRKNALLAAQLRSKGDIGQFEDAAKTLEVLQEKRSDLLERMEHVKNTYTTDRYMLVSLEREFENIVEDKKNIKDISRIQEEYRLAKLNVDESSIILENMSTSVGESEIRINESTKNYDYFVIAHPG